MKTIRVDLDFEGRALVKVPDHLDDSDARALAEKLVLSRILATFDNPDGPEDEAFDEWSDGCNSGTPEDDWDNSFTDDICGSWKAKVVE